ncbi:MAG: hypothetical protein ACI8QC_000964 [Planctomycetota bacterium]|jgi:hypothetical protein
MNLVEVTNGFGQLLPHSIQKLDPQGNPTPLITSILTYQDLVDNVSPGNDVLPVPHFEETAILPTGAAGNHFMAARFTQPLDLSTVLDGSSGGVTNSGLTGAVLVSHIEPLSGNSFPVIGRAFVNGQTYVAGPSGIELQTWVRADASGRPTVFQEDGVTPLVPGNPGLGYPGTETSFAGSENLISPNVLVFVPDSDGSLALHETFPTGVQVKMKITTAVRAENGKSLIHNALASSTVGEDIYGPEIITTPPPLSAPLITPGNGDVNVDPLTRVRVEFTEPVQPLSVGDLDDGSPPSLSSLVHLTFGPNTALTEVPFTVTPPSVFDLSVYELTPAFNFPGSGPSFSDCVANFSTVNIRIDPAQLEDLARIPNPQDPNEVNGNSNLLGADTFFVTGQGPGVVNTPVMPDAIYMGRSGASPGVSVVDLNGFGQTTGNPSFINGVPIEGNSIFPYNPNISQQTGLLPPISVGTCTIDGGSAGAFTLTRDSSLNDLLVRAPLVANVSDMMAGHALDGVFNNAPAPFGCQSGGGSVCAIDGLKAVAPVAAGPNSLGPLSQNQFGNGVAAGAENAISWAPHPNPPPLSFPPLCVSPFLNGLEPTTVDHFIGPVVGANSNPSKNNFLVPGDPFGTPNSDPPIPPSGLLTTEQNIYFLGPSQGQVSADACNIYQIRQQVGHFLYLLDRQRREITVFNSNRMTVVDRIPVPDPTSLAMGPNLDFLAVSNQSADTVSFIDIDPEKATFHQIVKTTVVGHGPRGIAWEPGNEDILVCNELDNSVSIISAFSLNVRRVVTSQMSGPFELCVFPRMAGFAFNRNAYFAYILNRTGTVAMYESGPNGTNGWGFDDIIGIAPMQFQNPKTIQPDPINLNAAAWVVHEGPIDPLTGQAGPAGEGAISMLFVESALSGTLLLGGGATTNPQFRSMQLAVQVSIGNEKLSGVPVDLAFDNMVNLGALPSVVTSFSAGAAAPTNSKNLIRSSAVNGLITNCSEPSYMFVAVPNAGGGSGVVDVFGVGSAGLQQTDTNAFLPGIQSIPAPNVTILADYWRQ